MTPLFWHYLLSAELPPLRSRALVEELGTGPLDPLNQLRAGVGLNPGERRMMEQASLRALEKALAQGVEVLEEPDFPVPLAEAEGRPPALFVWGQPEALHAPTVAIVGTRGASAYGKAAAFKFAQAFGEMGLTVVSGGALGIDTQAHEGALHGGGATAAVLGCGVDIAHPASNGPLFERIRESGCLVSQFGVGAPALAYRFPVRNYMIAALARAVLVVEAPSGSGSILTAHAAGELGRPVFVVPGAITQESFRGSHGLIRDGATLVDHPYQVMDVLHLDAAPKEPQPAAELSPVQARILEVLSAEPLTPEQIVAATGIDAPALLAELTDLEIEGVVIRAAEGYARKP